MSATTGTHDVSHAERPRCLQAWHELSGSDHFWMEWRFRVVVNALRDLGLDLDRRWLALDVGCGYGVVRRQLQQVSNWTVDGCDVDRDALQRQHLTGRTLLYDVHDQRPELESIYDVALLMDVVEHVEVPQPFLRAVIYHLKPGGLVVINVPALQSCYSQYDRAVGHWRRYTRRSLIEETHQAGLVPLKVGYWGFGLLPVLALRKLLMSVERDGDAAAVVSRGMKPPNASLHRMLKTWMRIETRLLPSPPLGSSVYLIAKRA